MELKQIPQEPLSKWKKLLAENMRLRKELRDTKHELETLKRFIGGE